MFTFLDEYPIILHSIGNRVCIRATRKEAIFTEGRYAQYYPENIQ